MEAAERRACSASITVVAAAWASGHCRGDAHPVRSRAAACQRRAVRQLPLLASARAGLTITTDEGHPNVIARRRGCERRHARRRARCAAGAAGAHAGARAGLRRGARARAAVPYDAGLNPAALGAGARGLVPGVVDRPQPAAVARRALRPEHERPPSTLPRPTTGSTPAASPTARAGTCRCPPPATARTGGHASSHAGLLDALPAAAPATTSSTSSAWCACTSRCMPRPPATWRARWASPVPLPPRPVGRQVPLRVPAQRSSWVWQGRGFAFDNELRRTPWTSPPFEIDAVPVTGPASPLRRRRRLRRAALVDRRRLAVAQRTRRTSRREAAARPAPPCT
jgi:hypothetical protein